MHAVRAETMGNERAHDDDPSRRRGPEIGKRRIDQTEEGERHRRKGAFDIRFRQVAEDGALGPASIGDDLVEPSEFCPRLRDKPARGVLLAKVAERGDDDGALAPRLIGDRLQARRIAAGMQQQPRAWGRDGSGDGRADAAAGAGNEDGG